MESTSIPAWERRAVTFLTRLFWFRSRKGKARAVPDWLPHEPFQLTAPDGARLNARWFPAANPRGTVVLAHPDRRYAQDWFVLTGWLDLVHDLGLNALTFDFVGYGASRGGTSYFHDHLGAMLVEARRRAPELPLHVVGVSLGAFVAANASREHKIDALILESPYPTFRSWYGNGYAARFLRGLELAFPRTGRRIDARRSLRHTHAKRILIVGSAGDSVTPLALTQELVAAAPKDRTRFLPLAGHEHLDLFPESQTFRDQVEELLVGPTGSRSPTVATTAVPRAHGLRRSHPHRTRSGLQPRPAAWAHHGQGRL